MNSNDIMEEFLSDSVRKKLDAITDEQISEAVKPIVKSFEDGLVKAFRDENTLATIRCIDDLKGMVYDYSFYSINIYQFVDSFSDSLGASGLRDVYHYSKFNNLICDVCDIDKISSIYQKFGLI